MFENVQLVGIVIIVLCVTSFVVFTRSDKKKDGSSDGNTVTPPANVLSPDELAEQKEIFASMTVPQLKSYVKENKNKMSEPMGRMPTKKAELIDKSLQIWTQEK